VKRRRIGSWISLCGRIDRIEDEASDAFGVIPQQGQCEAGPVGRALDRPHRNAQGAPRGYVHGILIGIICSELVSARYELLPACPGNPVEILPPVGRMVRSPCRNPVDLGIRQRRARQLESDQFVPLCASTMKSRSRVQNS
jgi:hypothetical protein